MQPVPDSKQIFSSKKETQPCLVCGEAIGVVAGSKDAICTNCGFKDPCCE